MCACVFHCVGLCVWLQVPKEVRGLRSPQAQVASHSEPPNMVAWNWTLVLCKGNMSSEFPSHLSRLLFFLFCWFTCSKKSISFILNLTLDLSILYLPFSRRSPLSSFFPLVQCYFQINLLTLPLCQWEELRFMSWFWTNYSCESQVLHLEWWYVGLERRPSS